MADALLDNARASFEEASAQHPGYGIDVVHGLGYLEADTIVHARLGPASVRPDVVWRVRRALAHGFTSRHVVERPQGRLRAVCKA